MRTVVMAFLLGACSSGGDGLDDGTNAPGDAPTWTEDVAPIVNANCNTCHRAEGIAERFDWTTYEAAYAWRDVIALNVAQRLMPPYIAGEDDSCTPRFDLMHDPRLPQHEIDTIVAWAEAGGPEGAPSQPLDPPEPPHLDRFDGEVAPDNGYTAEKGDVGICWSMKVDHIIPEGETWFLDGLEVVPGDSTVTHHIQIQVHEDGAVDERMGPEGWWDCTAEGGTGGTDFAGWLPGTRPVEMPEGVGVAMTSESRVTMQIHYHSVYDDPRYDVTTLRLRFAESPPEREPTIFRVGNYDEPKPFGGLLGNEYDIDPGDPRFYIPAERDWHVETMEYEVPGEREYEAFMLTNHMHVVGVSAQMTVEHANPREGEPKVECLLNTPQYDMNWQAFFTYDLTAGQVPKIRGGDIVRLTCAFDNSTSNDLWMETLETEGMADEWPFAVQLGESTTDEMCLGMVGVVEVE